MEYNNMKIKKTYEIIDVEPTSILTTIPIIDIFIYIAYYILLPFYIIKRFIDEKYFDPFFFVRKKEKFFFGQEKNNSIILEDLNNNEVVKNDIPEFTNIIFHYNKKAFILLNELKEKGFPFEKHKISNNFIIKEKIEYYNETSNIDEKIEVFFNTPKFLKKIKKIIPFK